MSNLVLELVLEFSHLQILKQAFWAYVCPPVPCRDKFKIGCGSFRTVEEEDVKLNILNGVKV